MCHTYIHAPLMMMHQVHVMAGCHRYSTHTPAAASLSPVTAFFSCLQIGHWLGLQQTWAQATTDQADGCVASADYTSQLAVVNGDSDGVRDTPPQTVAASGSDMPIFFNCTGTSLSTFFPKQSCTAATGYPAGNNYFANFVNFLSYYARPCVVGPHTFTPGQNARARCVYECYRQNQCFDGSFKW